MAETKKTPKEIDKIKEAPEEKKEAPEEKKVKIRLPRTKEDSADVFVSVNERTWIIKRGVEVEVPECVAEVIRNSEAMQEEAYEFDRKVQTVN